MEELIGLKGAMVAEHPMEIDAANAAPSDEQRHIGIFYINERTLAAWLRYDGARILHADYAPEYRGLRVFIEHPDLPLVRHGQDAPVVFPGYTSTTHECGHVTVDRAR